LDWVYSQHEHGGDEKISFLAETEPQFLSAHPYARKEMEEVNTFI
jgi:hypothetical protein